MFGRRKVAPPLFIVGLTLMVSGMGWDITALWIVGLVLFVVGIGLFWRRRSEFSPY